MIRRWIGPSLMLVVLASGCAAGGDDSSNCTPVPTTSSTPQPTPSTFRKVEIDFEGLTAADLPAEFGKWVRFASEPANTLVVWETSEASATDFFLCAADGFDCSHDITLSFQLPVDGLKFEMVGCSTNGQALVVSVEQEDGTFETVPVIGPGDQAAVTEVDLSDFDQIRRIRLGSITDDYGVGFDNFVFRFPE